MPRSLNMQPQAQHRTFIYDLSEQWNARIDSISGKTAYEVPRHRYLKTSGRGPRLRLAMISDSIISIDENWWWYKSRYHIYCNNLSEDEIKDNMLHILGAAEVT